MQPKSDQPMHLSAEIRNIQPKGFPSLPSAWHAVGERFTDHSQKIQLFGCAFENSKSKNPKTLVIAHGLGEHFGRYQHLPHYFENDFGRIVGCDHVGHGRSEGVRGHIEAFDHYVLDLIRFIRRWDEKIKQRFGKSEIHLLGHSMGGLVATRALLLEPELPLSSVTVVAPLFGILNNVPFWKKGAALLLRQVAGRIQIPNTVDSELLSHDPEVGKAYRIDRLVHDKITPTSYFSLLDAIEKTKQVLENNQQELFKIPTQFLLPLEDKIVDVQAAIAFAEKIRLPNKRVLVYEGLYHEALNEVSKERVMEDVRTWITEHSSLSGFAS